MLKKLALQFARDGIVVFKGYSLVAQIGACLLTIVLVLSGADWNFFEATRYPELLPIIMFAGLGGFFIPVAVPFFLFVFGVLRENTELKELSLAIAEAEALAYLLSIFYKTFTGRTQPEFITHVNTLDISRDFHFGILQHGIFWGWPSSHAAVAFGGAVVLALMVKSRVIKISAIFYACIIGFGAAIGFHWLSDSLAGAIMGTAVAFVVYKSTKPTEPPLR